MQHDLDYSEIDDLDEISGDEQFVLIWCATHRRWEWHWVPIRLVRIGARHRRLDTHSYAGMA
jgi:hypothetical protein